MPGFAPRWPTPRTDTPMPRRGARARPTTPRRRGSLWRKARGAYGRTRRTTAAKPEPDRQLRRARARRARPSSQLWWFNARYCSSPPKLLNFLLCCIKKLKTRGDTKTAMFCSHDSSLKAHSSLFSLYIRSLAGL